MGSAPLREGEVCSWLGVGVAWGGLMESLLSLGPLSAEVCFRIVVCWGLEGFVTVRSGGVCHRSWVGGR